MPCAERSVLRWLVFGNVLAIGLVAVIVGLSTDDQLAPWRRDAALVSALALLVALAGSSVVAYRIWRAELAGNRALLLEAQRHRAFMLTASDGIHVLDRSGRVVELSDSFAAMLGHAREDVLGMHVSQWDASLAPSAVDERMRDFQIGERREFVSQHRRRDGSIFEVDVISVGVRIEGQDLLFCSARDATERRRAEHALRASEAFLDRTGRVAGVGGWQLDLLSDEITWSDQTCRIHDVERGHRPTVDEALEFFPLEIRPSLVEHVVDSVVNGVPWDVEMPLTTAKGRSIWVRIFGEVEAEDGRPVRIIGALQDVTELRTRKAELEREQALRFEIERHALDLDELLRERGEMLDVLAHEVRQPLNNASAALQSAAAALAEVDEEVASFRVTRAQTVIGQVLARIDNTLAVAALLAQASTIVVEDTDIDTLISVVVADMPGVERHRIRIERLTSTRTASMDMSLMRLALRNLLSNALKFSPAGSLVIVRVSDSDEPLALVIEITDAGGGVDGDRVPGLFARGARSRTASGAAGQGLGLYIVRRVMELHSSRVELAANTPHGATMRLVIAQAPGQV